MKVVSIKETQKEIVEAQSCHSESMNKNPWRVLYGLYENVKGAA